MRSTVCAAFATALGFAALGLIQDLRSLAAQEASKEATQEGAKEGDPSARGKELFSQLDADGNGQLEASEIPEQQRRLFDRMIRTSDKDGDGKLSADEFIAGVTTDRATEEPSADAAGQAGPNLDVMFARLDRDADGKVAKDEIPEAARNRVEQLFNRLDANQDGAITKEEIEKVGANARQRFAALIRGQGAPGGAGGGRLFAALDIDGDGAISSQEIAAAAESLKKLDRNGDGSISRDEIGGAPTDPNSPGGLPAEQLVARLAQADSDRDGKLSEQELPERLRPIFKALDGNSDGFVDKEELRANIDKVREVIRGAGKAGASKAGKRRPERIPNWQEVIAQRDANKDGKLAKEELDERMQAAFQAMDTNEDGFIDREEWTALETRFRDMIRRLRSQKGKANPKQEEKP